MKFLILFFSSLFSKLSINTGVLDINQSTSEKLHFKKKSLTLILCLIIFNLLFKKLRMFVKDVLLSKRNLMSLIKVLKNEIFNFKLYKRGISLSFTNLLFIEIILAYS